MKVDRSQSTEEDDNFNITPLIDIVFLLLIYFMVTATILQEESDISINLPVPADRTDATPQSEELIIDIEANGQIRVNGEVVDDARARDLPELRRTLTRAKQLAELTGGRAMVVIQANEDSVHQRTVDVLNAASAARIRFVTFGSPAG